MRGSPVVLVAVAWLALSTQAADAPAGAGNNEAPAAGSFADRVLSGRRETPAPSEPSAPAAAPPAAATEAAAAAGTRDSLAELVISGQRSTPPSDVENIVITGRKEVFQLSDMQKVYESRERAGHLYRVGRYADAFPLLLQAAEGGDKLAQARVGYLYLTGFSGIARNADAGIGWLGVAASGTTRPDIRNYLDGIIKQLPKSVLPRVQQIIAQYVARYGEEATGMDCNLVRQAGTAVRQLTCRYQDEGSLLTPLDGDSPTNFIPLPVGAPPGEI